MRVAALIIALLAPLWLAACTSGDPAAEGPKAEPPKNDMTRADGVLKELYGSYFVVLNNGGKSDAGNYVDKYFTPDLAAKYAAATAKPENPIPFDIFINAQESRDLALGTLKRTLETASQAAYEVHFTNNGDEHKVKVSLTKVGNTWLITDIDYGQGLTLSGMLK